MLNVGIIGTAGRQSDRDRWTPEMYWLMYEKALSIISQYTQEFQVTSGGAALSDHLAVSLYLRKEAQGLNLFLPAKFNNSKFIGTSSYKHPGNVSNYYHKLFSQKMGGSSLRGIQKAIDRGANVVIKPGFHNRNILVGQVDLLIAFTFGTHSGTYEPQDDGWINPQAAGLKDGGTAHTWKNSSAPIKIHVCLPME